MKYTSFIIASCALMIMTAGCKKNNNHSNEPDSLLGNTTRPSWTATDNNHLTSSMTAVVKTDLTLYYADQAQTDEYQITDDDLLAAFAGNECLGVATPQDGLFYLYICSPSEENNTIVLKYYSAKMKNIFVSINSYSFENDGQLGTFAEPYTPLLKAER